MSNNSQADIERCVYRQAKTGGKVGCANLPVYGCAIHGKCIDRPSCRSGSLKTCSNCNDIKLPENYE